MTVTLGWWLVPFVLTLVFVGHLFIPLNRTGDYDFGFDGLIKSGALLIVALISWVVYLAFN